MRKTISVTLTVPEDWLEPDQGKTPREQLNKLGDRLQDSFDHYWSIQRMGTVRVESVMEAKEPSETDLCA